MGANPHANGGLLKKTLRLPDFREYAHQVRQARAGRSRKHATAGRLPARRDEGEHEHAFASLGLTKTPPTSSTRFTKSARSSGSLNTFPEDNDGGELSTDGRVIEMLSEHTLEGMLEGYLLTGRHGFFSTYEAFAHVIDSMFNQHAKWLSICNELSWRRIDSFAQSADHFHGLAAGSQRLYASGSRASSMWS